MFLILLIHKKSAISIFQSLPVLLFFKRLPSWRLHSHFILLILLMTLYELFFRFRRVSVTFLLEFFVLRWPEEIIFLVSSSRIANLRVLIYYQPSQTFAYLYSDSLSFPQLLSFYYLLWRDSRSLPVLHHEVVVIFLSPAFAIFLIFPNNHSSLSCLASLEKHCYLRLM